MKVHVAGGHTLSSRGIGNPRPPTPALSDNSSRGGTGYAVSLRGNSINFRGNTLTLLTSYISLRKDDVIVYF